MFEPSQVTKVDIANFHQQEVGKKIKSSKVEYVYEFFISGVLQVVKLVRSYFSGKIRIFVNGECIHKEDKFIGDKFMFSFNCKDFKIMFEQKGAKVFNLDVIQTGTSKPTVDRAKKMNFPGDVSPWSGNQTPKRKESQKTFILLDSNHVLNDKQLNSPVRSVPFSPYNGKNHGDYTTFEIGNTPRYDCPYQRVTTHDESLKESTPRGFTAKVQPYFATSKRTVNRNSVGLGFGDFVPLTPQPDLESSRKRADSSPDSVNKFYTPQLLSRTISHQSLTNGKQYPGRTLASPVNKKLKRQDSDSLLTEDSIVFVRTEL